MTGRRSPNVLAFSAAVIRSSSSSRVSRPSAKCSRSRSVTCSRSASETRIRSCRAPPSYIAMLASIWIVGVSSGVGVGRVVLFVVLFVFVFVFVFVVIGQDLVQPAPGLLEQLFGFADLLGRAGVRHLHDAAGQPRGLGEQPGRLPRLLLGPRLPRAAGLVRVLLDVGAPGVGQAERAPAVRLLAHDQALVGELGQRRVDRARAGLPRAATAFPDLGHDLVARARALQQQRQDRGPHVTAARLGRARGARGTGLAREAAPSPQAAPLRPKPAAPGPAALAPASPGAGRCPFPGAALVAPAKVVGEHSELGLPQMADQAASAAEHLGQAGIEVPSAPPWSRHPAPPVQFSRYDRDISIAYDAIASMTRYDATIAALDVLPQAVGRTAATAAYRA